MKIILKVVLVIFVLFTFSLTACSCGGDTESSNPSGSSGDGFIDFFNNDSSEEPEDTSNDQNEYGIHGEVNGEEISVLSEDTTVEITVLDSNDNQETDNGDELLIKVNNFQQYIDNDREITSYSMYLNIKESYDLSSISINIDYELDDEGAYGTHFSITQPGEYSETISENNGHVIFDEFNVPEDGGQISGEYELELEDGSIISGQFSGTAELESPYSVSQD